MPTGTKRRIMPPIRSTHYASESELDHLVPRAPRPDGRAWRARKLGMCCSKTSPNCAEIRDRGQDPIPRCGVHVNQGCPPANGRARPSWSRDSGTLALPVLTRIELEGANPIVPPADFTLPPVSCLPNSQP